MKHNYVIFSEPLKLRQVKSDDLEKLIEWRNHDQIRKWFFNKDIITLEKQRAWYENYLNDEKDIMFIIEEIRDIREPIGACALYDINYETGTAEFGRLMIGNFKARGKGNGLKSVNAACCFGFKRLKMEKIILEVFENNISALKIYLQAGFKIVKRNTGNNAGILTMKLQKIEFLTQNIQDIYCCGD